MEVEVEDAVSVQKKIKHDQEVEKDVENSSNTSGSTSNSENHKDSNSDVSYEDEGNADDQDDEDDAIQDDSDYYLYPDDDDDDDDHYASMQAQFDNVDLPTGVEASVSWMETTTPKWDNSVPPNVSAEVLAKFSSKVAALASSVANAPSSSSLCVESSSSGKEKEQLVRKYENFKQFDVVDDHSDHHYSDSGFRDQQPPKAWGKKIQGEWKILENDLPGTIYVRVYESRMDLMRAVIVGPQGTPYHDGLFVFDVVFPPTYPDVPPMVYYYSGGLRLNPNLYDNGKVCLSLLNTWTGKGCEKWVPNKSTMLQVLVSIQALILNEHPFFNEPGYEKSYTGKAGQDRAREYNEDVFILSLKTMMYTLRRPPKHFEDLVSNHFRACAHDILSACRAYSEGVEVGLVVHGKVPVDSAVNKDGSHTFKVVLGRMINGLVSNFTRYGVPDCEQFRGVPS